MAYDFKDLPNKVVLDLIKTDNPKAANLTNDLVQFGLPTASQSGASRNTQLTITAAPGSGYTGSVDVLYNRVALVDFVGKKDLTFLLGDATKLKDLIPEINELLGINLTGDDYQDVTLPEFEGTANEVHEVQLVTSADSLCYLGSLTIKIKGEDIELGSVITERELNGLQAPAQPADSGTTQPT